MSLNINNIISSSVSIGGKTFQGDNVSIINGEVFVDGVKQDDVSKQPKIEVIINGNVGDVELSGGNMKCGDVDGDVRVSGGNIDAGDIEGDVRASGGNINCDKVGGNVKASGGNVNHR